MIIKSLTMVGNECEIIESFIRYNINIFDEMVFVFNFGSVDHSIDIVKKIRDEGLRIRIYDEPLVAYEQKAIENKYIRRLADEGNVDLIIPIDADEFVASASDPRCILENLDLNYLYKVKWLNYLMTKEDDSNELFIPKRMEYCDPQATTYDKVIIPAWMIRDREVVVQTGHHGVNGVVEEKTIQDIYFAHYPLISFEQYKSKIYCSSINFINWMNRSEGEGNHINKLLADIEQDDYSGFSIYNTSSSDSIIRMPLQIDFIENASERLKIRYVKYNKVDLVYNLTKTAQKMAIRAYNYEIAGKFVDVNGIKVMIYGTGKAAESLLNGIPDELVNVICYINSDNCMKFTRFRKRLVVTPEYIKLFDYNKIIISSRKYFTEMRNTLLEYGVAENDIVDENYLIDLLIKRLSDKERNVEIK